MIVARVRRYIAWLAVYKSGILHGEWIEIEGDIDNTWNRIRSMLACSPIEGAEEWESIERVHELSEFMQEHGKIGSLVLEHYCGDIDDAQRTIENYIGCYCRMGDYAQEITESCTEIPEHLKFYIDYERIERDMEMNGDIFTIETGFDEIHIFLNN